MDALEINDALVIPEKDLSVTFSLAGGPGGQNVNKVATSVTLRFDLAGNETLPVVVRKRLQKLAGSRLTKNGELLIRCRQTRSQSDNLATCYERLRQLVCDALVAPKIRKATKPSRGAKRRRLENKRKQSEKKRGRGRVGSERD
jgi:ribosome-associated protein